MFGKDWEGYGRTWREERDRRDRKQEENLSRILAAVVDRDRNKVERIRQTGDLGGKKRQGPRRPGREQP